jgi:TfoX/Sxy family transcriptional regulator of competence genes
MLDESFCEFVVDQLQTLKSYYEVPVDVLEDHAQLTVWARQAIACHTAEDLSMA